MLYIFSGDDAKNKRVAYERFVSSIQKDTEKFFINRNNFDREQIISLYSGAGLFFSKCAVVLEGIFEQEETAEFILGKLEQMSESPNDFIFLEGKLGKPVIDDFKKAKAEVKIFELPKEKKEKFNNFLLANAFGARDKKGLWIYFRQAVDLGVGMEELIGVLFWKVKDMLLKKTYGKFKEPELKNFAAKISYILPEARKSGIDAEAAFEQFLLEAF